MGFIKTLFGGKTKGEKANDATYKSSFTPIVDQGSKYTAEYHDLAAPVLKTAASSLNPVLTHFSNILNGGQGWMESMEPELSAEAAAYKNVSASSAFAPRGAGQVSRQGQLDTQHLSDIASILSKGRTAALSGMMNISQILSSLGLGEAGLSNQESGTIGSLLNQFRQGNVQEYEARNRALSDMVGTIGGIVAGAATGGLTSVAGAGNAANLPMLNRSLPDLFKYGTTR